MVLPGVRAAELPTSASLPSDATVSSWGPSPVGTRPIPLPDAGSTMASAPSSLLSTSSAVEGVSAAAATASIAANAIRHLFRITGICLYFQDLCGVARGMSRQQQQAPIGLGGLGDGSRSRVPAQIVLRGANVLDGVIARGVELGGGFGGRRQGSVR